MGYGPPQTVSVMSLKDGLEARLPDGSYEPKIAPAVTDVGLGLAEVRRAGSEAMLNSLRGVWV